MKKFAVFFLLLFIALTGNSFAVSDDVKKQVESLVLPALKAKNIQVDSVDFSTKNVVKLKGISVKDIVVPGGSLKIAEVVFTDINEDIFSAKAGDMPLVAKSVDFNGLELSFAVNEQSTTMSIGNINADSPMQNVVGLLQKDIDLKTYVALLRKVTANSVTYSDIKINQEGKDIASGLLADIKQARIDKLGLEKIKSFKLSGIEAKLKKGSEFSGEIVRMGSFATVDLLIPSEAYMLFMIENFKEIATKTLSPEAAKKHAEFTNELSDSHESFKAKVEDFVFENAPNKQPAKFKEILLDVALDQKTKAKFDFSLLFKGSELDYAAMGADPSLLVPLFKTDKPVLDFALQSVIKSDGTLSNIAVYAIDNNNGPAVKLEAKLMFPKADLTEIFSSTATPEQALMFFMGAQFAEFSIDSDALNVQMPNTPRPTVVLDSAKTLVTHDYTSSTKADLNIDIPGLTLDLAQMLPPSELDPAKALLGTDLLNLITNLKFNLVTDGSASTLEYNIKVKDTATVNAKLSLVMPTVKISDVIGIPPNETKIQQFLLASVLSGLNIVYEDSGLASRGLQVFSAMQGAKPEQMLAQLLPMVGGVLESQKHLLTPTSIDAVKLCIQKPGKLTFTATPKNPIPANPASMALLQDPNAISYDVKCEAGKDIAEVNALTQLAESAVKDEQKKN